MGGDQYYSRLIKPRKPFGIFLSGFSYPGGPRDRLLGSRLLGYNTGSDYRSLTVIPEPSDFTRQTPAKANRRS